MSARRMELALTLLLATACVSRESAARRDTNRASDSTAAKPVSASRVGDSARLTTSAPPSSRDSARMVDSVIARARILLRQQRPEFREWEDTTAPPRSADYSDESGLVAGPVAADLDQDGTLDVAFIGRDSTGERVLAVLSRHGQPAVEEVTAELTGGRGGSSRRQWMHVVAVGTNPSHVGLEILERNEDPKIPAATAQFIVVDGHFSSWVDGE